MQWAPVTAPPEYIREQIKRGYKVTSSIPVEEDDGSQHVMVEWEEAWEPANIFEQCPDHWTKIRDDYENEKNQPAHTDIAIHLEDTADD